MTRPTLSAELRHRLLLPQLAAVRARLERGGIAAGKEARDDVVELLYGPLVYRWLLRAEPPRTGWVADHVARFLLAVGVAGADTPVGRDDDPGTPREDSRRPG